MANKFKLYQTELGINNIDLKKIRNIIKNKNLDIKDSISDSEKTIIKKKSRKKLIKIIGKEGLAKIKLINKDLRK